MAAAKQSIKIKTTADDDNKEEKRPIAKKPAVKKKITSKKKSAKKAPPKTTTKKAASKAKPKAKTKAKSKAKENIAEKIIKTDEGDLKVKIKSFKKEETAALEEDKTAVAESEDVKSAKKAINVPISGAAPADDTNLNSIQARSKVKPKKIVEDLLENKLHIDENKFKEEAETKSSWPETPADEALPKPRPIKLYRKIAISFIALTVILLSVIGYFTFVKASIILIPNQERLSNNLIFDIINEDAAAEENNKAIKGIVKEVPISISDTYNATEAEVIGEETVGTVKIINNYIKSQPLVATTRLLSPENKLYRTKETVTVPAGGEAEVEVYADIPGENKAIGPTTFTIPGLWAGIQDKIYAKSTEAFEFKQRKKMSIKEEDIENGIRELKQNLLAKAKEDINEMYREYDQIIYSVDENSIDYLSDSKAGEEKDNFTIDMEANVITVAFDEDQASDLAKQKFSSSLADNKEIISFEEENILYSLHEFDIDKGIASVNATFEGKVSIKENAQIIEIDKILGLNEKQLEAYLSGLPEIAGYEIKFFPSFIKKVPSLADRVKVEIKK